MKLSDDAYRAALPLCPVHRKIALEWRDHFYKPHNPTEWPGGCHIQDSRTTHAEREAEWDRKNAAQIKLTAEICHSGRSPAVRGRLVELSGLDALDERCPFVRGERQGRVAAVADVDTSVLGVAAGGHVDAAACLTETGLGPILDRVVAHVPMVRGVRPAFGMALDMRPGGAALALCLTFGYSGGMDSICNLQIITDLDAYEGGHTHGWIVPAGTSLTDARDQAIAAIRIPITPDEGTWNTGLKAALAEAGYTLGEEIPQAGSLFVAVVTEDAGRQSCPCGGSKGTFYVQAPVSGRENIKKDFVQSDVVSAVSTIAMFDAKGYETAVGLPVGGFANTGQWYPVERYKTAQEALEGHKRWLKLAPTLVAVRSLGLPGSEPKHVDLVAELARLREGR